jgi:hypothetical protein
MLALEMPETAHTWVQARTASRIACERLTPSRSARLVSASSSSASIRGVVLVHESALNHGIEAADAIYAAENWVFAAPQNDDSPDARVPTRLRLARTAA